MDIFEADVSDTEYLVKHLWRPLADEMADISDFNALADEKVNETAMNYLADRLSDNDHTIFLMEIDEQPAGFLALEVKSAQKFFDRGLYGHIHELFIVKQFRRNGAASKLLKKAEEYCEENNCEMIQLSVNVRNDAAQKLYRNSGFEKERVKMVKEF